MSANRSFDAVVVKTLVGGMTVYHAMCLVVVQSGWCCAQRPHGSGATQAAAIADLKSQLTANAMIQSVEIVRVNL